MKLLTQYEDRLSIVMRWGIVRTIQRQSVQEHVGRVALIAPRIATRYFGVPDTNYKFLYNLSRAALLHDQYEAFTGDLPTPAKRHMDVKSVEHHFRNKVQEAWYDDELTLKILKAADCFEALCFLGVERDLGNLTLLDIITDIRNALIKCVGDEIANTMMGEIEARKAQDALRDV